MKWTLQGVQKLPQGPVKVRLLAELKANRRSPVTGSFAYWERVITSKTTDYRKNPERYESGKGEQGVLGTHPYTDEILPYWRFKTEDDAAISAITIYMLFENYIGEADYVGADIAKKFLQMGFTRARRYANHPSGQKYNSQKTVRARANDSQANEKALAAAIFKHFWDASRENKSFKTLQTNFKDFKAAKIPYYP